MGTPGWQEYLPRQWTCCLTLARIVYSESMSRARMRSGALHRNQTSHLPATAIQVDCGGPIRSLMQCFRLGPCTGWLRGNGEKPMKILKNRARAGVRRLAVIALGASLGMCVAVRGQQATSSDQLSETPAPSPQAPATLALQDAPQPQPSAAAAGQENGQAQSAQSSSSAANQQPPQKPVGAAAAPPESAAGVTASRPAGAVIAPAKQRRARAILIRVGLLVGAGVALGTVMALSHATPSQPQ